MKPKMESSRNAEALFETRSVVEIRQVEAQTRKEIKEKQEELRQLIGTSYRDLIESADNILGMKKSCQMVSLNIQSIEKGFASLHKIVSDSAPPTPQVQTEKKRRAELYEIGCRVKYLVDTSENIWGCLDECMFLEAARRYVRAREVYGVLVENKEEVIEKSFPLLRHEWQLVENFKDQISQKSRDRLHEKFLDIESYAVALAAVAVIDELVPKEIFEMFLETRTSWLRQRLQRSTADGVTNILCDVVKIVQGTLCQIGQLFLEVLSDLPLFYKTVLAVPPGSQLFGGIPNPDAEVQRWKSHREYLESAMAVLPNEFITDSCLKWLKACADEVINFPLLLSDIKSGKELSEIEFAVKETLESHEAFLGSLDWLKSVFASKIGAPWQCLCELVLKKQLSLWDYFFEGVFVSKMKDIICLGFTDLSKKVMLEHCMANIVAAPEYSAFSEVLKKQTSWNPSDPERRNADGVQYNQTREGCALSLNLMSDKDWVHFLNSFFGSDVSQIKDTIDQESRNILLDLTTFLLPRKSSTRVEELGCYMQEQCFRYLSALLGQIEEIITSLSATLLRLMKTEQQSQLVNSQTLESSVVVKRALFLGRISVALNFHSASVPLILGAPQLWFDEKHTTVIGKGLLKSSYFMSEVDQSILGYSTRQTLTKGIGLNSSTQENAEVSKLNDLRRNLRRLCIRAHNIWISWITEVLSRTLADNISRDDSLSTNVPLKGWEETVIKEDQDGRGQSETTICLPAMPSLYISAFLFQGCQEIYKIGGHVLDRVIMRLFTWRLLDKVLKTYEDLFSSEDFEGWVSEKGLLQVLFDIRFVADVLSGGQDVPFDTVDFEIKSVQAGRNLPSLATAKWKSIHSEVSEGAWRKRADGLIKRIYAKLDPVDWATYEPYLWENERQGYQRTAVLFGFLVELNRLYTNSALKVSTKPDSNSLKTHASNTRFALLPISTPILSNVSSSTLLHGASDDQLGKNSWKAFSNANLSSKFDFEDTSSFGVATPLLKSFMSQVGSKFGEGTFRLGSMLTDSQVGRLKDKSAAAMSTFGDMLPAQAAGLLSSLTVGGGYRPEN